METQEGKYGFVAHLHDRLPSGINAFFDDKFVTLLLGANLPGLAAAGAAAAFFAPVLKSLTAEAEARRSAMKRRVNFENIFTTINLCILCVMPPRGITCGVKERACSLSSSLLVVDEPADRDIHSTLRAYLIVRVRIREQ